MSHALWKLSTPFCGNQIIPIFVEFWESSSAYCSMSKNCCFLCFACFSSCLSMKICYLSLNSDWKQKYPTLEFQISIILNFNNIWFFYKSFCSVFSFRFFFYILKFNSVFCVWQISASEIFKNQMFLCVCWLPLKVVHFFVHFVIFFLLWVDFFSPEFNWEWV